MFVYLCSYKHYIQKLFKKKEISIQICKLGNALNANEECPWMLMRKCLLAMLILMLVILMLILMLLNLNTGYADTDADLYIRIMSLCCNKGSVCIINKELVYWKGKSISWIMKYSILNAGFKWYLVTLAFCFRVFLFYFLFVF